MLKKIIKKTIKLIKKPFKMFFKSAFFTYILGQFAYYYSLWVWKTTRWDIIGLNRLYPIWDKDKAIVLTIWHGRVLMLPFFWNKKHPLNALVSPHADGRIVSVFLKKVGFGTIDGSSNEDANVAAINLLRSIEKDEAIAIIPDGPRGPRMKMNKSPLYFAQKSGKPLFGASYTIQRSFVLKTWDAMLFPLPYSRGILNITEPYYIPENATPEDIEKYRQAIENELNEMTHRSDKVLGLPYIEPGVTAKVKRYKSLPKKESEDVHQDV